jgi:hypothetical protein
METYPPHDLIREDGRLEKLCKHGIGHTVGHSNPKMLDEAWIWIHGCDECCSGFIRQIEEPE